ncbi:MAG: T9SS type A sorting domain-containing protein [Bacteroidia bacterium]|nr:T9SS type A sorting domain-containing protein [Bacteroidia bacterium]
MKLPTLLFKLLLGATIFFLGNSLKAQTTLYSEDFETSPVAEGFTGPVAANSVFTSSNGKWTLTAATTQGIFDANDHARVEDNVVGFGSTSFPSTSGSRVFQFRDVDEPITWRSQVVDISNYNTVNFEVDIFEVGSLESSDSTVVAYILDGVRTVVVRRFDDYSDADGTGSSSSSDPGNTNPVVLNPTVNGLSGSTLQIELIVDVNSSSELPHLDNVLISGFGFTPPVCSFQFGNNSGVCDAFTSGVDTYTATFNYSGAGNGNYTVTSNAGTVVLDNNPDNISSGSFRVIGIPEGTDVTATVNGVNCTNVTSTVTSPTCGQPAPGSFTLTSLSVATAIFPRITWTGSLNADNYTVELSINGGAFQPRTVVGNTTFTFTDTVAVFGQSLTYRVKASNNSGSTLSNTLSVTPPAIIERLELRYNCYDAGNNELVWDVINPNIQNIPFIYAQWWSPQRDTLIASNRSTSNFRTLVNPQDPSTIGDDNITGIWWVDQTLQAGEPNDLVFTIDLANSCASGRVSNPAPQAPSWMISNSVVQSFFSTTDITEQSIAAQISVGPNPFADVIYIHSEEINGSATVTLYDLTGKEVFKDQINLNFQNEIKVQSLQAGIYLLKIGTGEAAYTTKLTKK